MKKLSTNLAAIMLVFALMLSTVGCGTTQEQASTSGVNQTESVSDEYSTDPVYQYVIEKEPDIVQYLDLSQGGMSSTVLSGKLGFMAYSKTRADFPTLAAILVPLVNDYVKEHKYSIEFLTIMYSPENDKENAVSWNADKNNGTKGTLVDRSVDGLAGNASDLPYDQIKNYIDETTGNNTASQSAAAETSQTKDESSKEITYEDISTYDGFVSICKANLELEKSDIMTGEMVSLIEEYFPVLYASCNGRDVNDDEYDSWASSLMLAFTYMAEYFEPGSIGYAIGDYGLRSVYYTAITDNTNYEFKTAIDDLKAAGEEVGLNLSTMLLVGKVSAGQYKVGTDIEPGEYLVLADSDSGYFCVSSDAAGRDITFNDNFTYNSYITVESGEYLKLSRCTAYPVDVNVIELDKSGEGMYRIGIDLPAGEYKLLANSDSGYYCVYPDSRQDDIIANDNFSGQSYITVSDGEYLKLSRCHIGE